MNRIIFEITNKDNGNTGYFDGFVNIDGITYDLKYTDRDLYNSFNDNLLKHLKMFDSVEELYEEIERTTGDLLDKMCNEKYITSEKKFVDGWEYIASYKGSFDIDIKHCFIRNVFDDKYDIYF